MTKLTLVLLFLTVAHPSTFAATGYGTHTVQIGEISYFGYAGIDLAPIRAQLPLHPGDTLTYATVTKGPAIPVTPQLSHHPRSHSSDPNGKLQQLIDAHNSAAILAAASKPLGS